SSLSVTRISRPPSATSVPSLTSPTPPAIGSASDWKPDRASLGVQGRIGRSTGVNYTRLHSHTVTTEASSDAQTLRPSRKPCGFGQRGVCRARGRAPLGGAEHRRYGRHWRRYTCAAEYALRRRLRVN